MCTRIAGKHSKQPPRATQISDPPQRQTPEYTTACAREEQPRATQISDPPQRQTPEYTTACARELQANEWAHPYQTPRHRTLKTAASDHTDVQHCGTQRRVHEINRARAGMAVPNITRSEYSRMGPSKQRHTASGKSPAGCNRSDGGRRTLKYPTAGARN